MTLEINKIHLIDCIDGFKRLDEKSIDIIVTSPPYNIGVNYNKYNDNMAYNNYLLFMNIVAIEMKRVLKDDGSIYLNMGGTLKNPWTPIDVANQFRPLFVLQNSIHWVKSLSVDNVSSYGHYKPINSDKYHYNGHEYIWHFTKSGDVKINKFNIGVPYKDKSNIKRWKSGNKGDVRDRGNVWFIPYETVNSLKQHPSTFPVMLPKMCILDCGINENTLVLDPFIGIGTTALACIDIGVNYIGFEIDEEYIKIANTNITNMRGN